MTLLPPLQQYFILKNGYKETIPLPIDNNNKKSIALINICLPSELPFDLISNREDVYKILYTKEGPNIRHSSQWESKFLQNFNHILTYWNPLLSNNIVSYCPFIHRLDLDNQLHNKLLLKNDSYDRKIVMVLECRNLEGNYNISNINLQCLDPLRKIMAHHLNNLTVIGPGWKNFMGNNHKTKVIDTERGRWDDKTVIEHLEDYTFNLVIENCNGEGYVSEKIYDSFMAGCIPLYLGNIDNNLPNIPKNMYIDLKQFSDVDQINIFLNNLTYMDIKRYKESIINNREKVLKNVSPNVFAEKVYDVYKLSEI